MDPQLLPWQAVFFDFDGVIAVATEVKVRAFATLFAPFGPGIQETVVRYHLENGGIPREQKLRHCFEVIVGQSVAEEELAGMGLAFADLVQDEMVAAPLLPGAMSTLRHLHASRIPAFVVSGTPHDEMRRIVDRKELKPYFLEVHGSPRPKNQIVRELLERYRYVPHRCLFIGDAQADYRAAMENGLRFLGIVPEGEGSIFPEGVPTSARVTWSL